jgi:hypothetical protein
MDANRRVATQVSRTYFKFALGALAIFSLAGAIHNVCAQNAPAEKVIYNFTPAKGYYPTGVIRDDAENLYVATVYGGSNGSCPLGCGNILKVSSPDRLPTVLYTFAPGLDNAGQGPTGLVRDSKGNLYGATGDGGHYKFGTVLELKPSGAEGILHNFPDGPDDGYYTGAHN